ncbi:MAG: helix-turn-helix domain-containing protein [Flavobacteriales bacterium]|nr:helix-turn-helix domain-containing protein [Flavobacteriales bacterium]
MKLEVITKDDLYQMKAELLNEISALLQGKTDQKKWLKSTDVRDMLGISPGTLQNLRVNGILPYTKVGGTLYYAHEDVLQVLLKNKRNAA